MPWQQIQILEEVALAMLLGGLIGFEREMADKPAGFRTNMLVAGAAALLVGLSNSLTEHFGDSMGGTMRTDPVRVVEAIITGISFLGAGTIFRRSASEQVQGLTTAASLLVCGGIGIAVALRQFWVAVGATLLALVVLRGLRFIERLLRRTGSHS
jgi:putative Mg2+ transporter-C (MgtC) family protein